VDLPPLTDPDVEPMTRGCAQLDVPDVPAAMVAQIADAHEDGERDAKRHCDNDKEVVNTWRPGDENT
jgi:hypothetical protein